MVLLIVQRRVDGWYLKSPLHPQCMFYHWYCKSSSEGYLKGVSFTLECMFVYHWYCIQRRVGGQQLDCFT